MSIRFKNIDDWHAFQIADFTLDCIQKLTKIEKFASDNYYIYLILNSNVGRSIQFYIHTMLKGTASDDILRRKFKIIKSHRTTNSNQNIKLCDRSKQCQLV